MNQDLTTGKPSRVLWKFCLPLFGSIIFQQLYNIADSFVAGKFIGENALAAVGNSYEITLIFIAFAFGCNIGCSVVAAQFFGAKDLRSMKTTIYTTLIASAGLCAVLMLVGLLLSRQLLGLINTPDEIMKDSQLYLNIYICGLPFVFFYNVATGIFSALGDSKTPFFFLMASSLSNIAVDILFVTAFGMGVDGVAWATFLCQGVSCVLALAFVFRRLAKIHLPESQRAPAFSVRLLGRVARVAIPSILQQSFVSVGNIVLQSIINSFGTAVMAGYSASVKLNNLVITSLVTLGNGISNFTAQNLGAGDTKRIKKGTIQSIIIMLIMAACSILIGLLLTINGTYLHIFLSADKVTAETLRFGNSYLYIDLSLYAFLGLIFVARNCVQGIGKPQFVLGAGAAELVARVAVCLLLPAALAGGVVSAEAPQAAVYGLCVADPFAWMSADAVLCIPLIKNIMRENYDYLYGSGQKLIER